MNKPVRRSKFLRNTFYYLFLFGWLVAGCSLVGPASSPTGPAEIAAPPTAFSPPAASPKTIFPSCSPVIVPVDPALATAFTTPTPAPADSPPTLRSLAEKRGLRIGAAVFPEGVTDPAYASLLGREFNMLTPENAINMKYSQPQPGQFDFTRADTLVAFAQANQMAVYGHVLVWDGDLPDWITGRSFTREQMMQVLCTHIKTVVNHYRDQVYAWTVVNEPFDDKGQLRNTLFLQSIGPDYIAMAFQWANEADPSAVLVLNETYAEGLNRKSQAVYALAQGLLNNGVPLHAVGLQMHVILGSAPTSDELQANMQRLAGLGLQVYITEMDIRTQYSSESTPEITTRFTQIYQQSMAACLRTPACRIFNTWGLTDRYTWITWWTGNPDSPLLFDQDYQPKPAYFALLELLKE